MSDNINYLRRRESISEDEDEEQQMDVSQHLPPHCCDYCQLVSVDSVAKCANKTCNRWFCNGSTKQGVGSHIILHMIKSKHREIVLHENNRVGITNVECYICENKNLFVLGYVNVTIEDSESILMLCRQPCAMLKEFNSIKWDPLEFLPLIQEKALQDWLVQQPSEKQLKKTRVVAIDKISQLEDLRRQNPALRYEDLVKQDMRQRQLKECQLRYVDGKHYQQVFSPLIKIEEEYDKQAKESQTQQGITVRWDFSMKKKRQAYFFYAAKEDFDANMLIGNELELSLKTATHQWSSKGTVVKVMNNDEVCLELYSNEAPPPVNTGYSVEFIWKSITYKRIQKGLRRFWQQEDSISSYLYYSILGQPPANMPTMITNIPQKLSAPNLPDLNVYQAEACKRALKQPLTLIQGPPGTGKTVTSATLVYQLVKYIQKDKKHGQVLVCAPSNIVVDQLAEKINLTGLKVVRLCSKTRESVSGGIEFLTLHNQIRSLDIPQYQQLQKLYQLLEDQGEFSGKEEQQFLKLRDEAERDILNSADVICTTCIGSADNRLKGLKFHHVLIDEATQAIEPECLLPMLKGAKHVILVGDHRQLGPVVTCRLSAKAGLDRPLFERLVALGVRPVRLQVQYRMHPDLSVFPSNTFYEGTLQNGVTMSDRTHKGDFAWPNPSKPMMFLNICGVEQISASGTSYLNTSEASSVERIVFYLVKSGVRAPQIGIITPYKGQRAYIVNYLAKNGQLNAQLYQQIEIASVDGFQGREKDFIIISCVRSNDGVGIGFLTNPRRLNVTITRARYGLIICGNAKVLSRDNLWNNLLNHFKDQNLLMEGNLPHLRECQLKFRPSQKFIPERRNTTMQDDNQNDNKSVYSYGKSDNLNQFETDPGEFPIMQGIRKSDLGFNIIPDTQAFQKPVDRDEFKKRFENIGAFEEAQLVPFVVDPQRPIEPPQAVSPETPVKDSMQVIGTILPEDFSLDI